MSLPFPYGRGDVRRSWAAPVLGPRRGHERRRHRRRPAPDSFPTSSAPSASSPPAWRGREAAGAGSGAAEAGEGWRAAPRRGGHGAAEAGRPRCCGCGPECRSAAWRRLTRRPWRAEVAARCGGGQACWIAGAPRGGPLRAGARRRAARWRRRGGVRRGSAEARLGRSFGSRREMYIWVRSSTGPKMGHRDGCSVGGLFSPRNDCARPIFRFRLYCWRLSH